MIEKKVTDKAFRSLLLRAIFLPLAVMTLLVVFVVWQIWSVRTEAFWVTHTSQVEESTRRLQNTLIDMETGMRGFLLSGDPKYLEPYELAQPKLDPLVSDLLKKVSDNPVQSTRILKIESTAKRWEGYASGRIAQQNKNPGPGMYREDLQGKLLMDEIRIQLSSVLDEEKHLMDQRLQASERAHDRLLWLVILGLLGSGALFSVFSRRQLQALSSVFRKALEAEATRTQDLQDSQTQLTAERLRFSRTATATYLGVWYCNLPFSDLIWDDTTKRHFWLNSNAHVTIDTFYERLHPDDRERTKKAIENSIQNHASYDIEYRTTDPTHQSTFKWIRAIGWTDYDQSGAPIRFDGITLDVTLAKNQHEDLMHALHARDEFLSIASHELKTPITSMKLQNQLAKREILKGNPRVYSKERVDLRIEQNHKQLNRLTRLIDDMLDMSRIRTGKLTIQKEHLDLCELVRETVERMSPQFTESKAALPELELSEPAFGNWDRMRMEQVIANLLTNALRYGKKAPIHICIECLPDKLRLSVRDQGIGISQDDLKRIFAPFERVVNANEVSGLGLGLYITQQIVKSHGGEIQVESKLGVGSTFHVEVPRDSQLVDGGAAHTLA